MGGIRKNINFQLNCADWSLYPRDAVTDEELQKLAKPQLRLAPITGGSENVGYSDESRFYYDLIGACAAAGIKLSIGDGCPDIKLQSGIKAVRCESEKSLQNGGAPLTAAVFIKPYSNQKILERAEWSRPVAEIIGIDIDAYNIVTMRNLVRLEKKTSTT